MPNPAIKLRALDALRNRLSPDCRVLSETGVFDHGYTSLEWAPIHPGTVRGCIGATEVTDNMNGQLLDRHGQLIATLNYLSGGMQFCERNAPYAPYVLSYYCNPNAVPPSPVEIQLITTQINPVVHRVKPKAKIKSLRRSA